MNAPLFRSYLVLRGTLFSAFLFGFVAHTARSQEQSAPVQASGVLPSEQVEFLSDTQGADFNPYVHALLQRVNAEWQGLPPVGTPAWATIRVTIHHNGEIAAMYLDSSSQNSSFTRHAWDSLVGLGQLAPLPESFSGHDLELRIGFSTSTSSSGQ